MGKEQKALETYLVGGAIRDELLGETPIDRDYLVLNSSKDELIDLGFVPVGKSFEVFLHPKTRNEYTLSNGPLNKELERRDLTINSMAKNLANGELVDPFGGLQDIKKKVLRRTSDRFKDDPIRVLRLARFKAKLVGFMVDRETESFTKELIQIPRLFENIPVERLKIEFHKALAGPRPDVFLQTLSEWKATAEIFPELENELNLKIEALRKARGRDISVLWGILCYQSSGFRDQIGADSYHHKLAQKLDKYALSLLNISKQSNERILEVVLGVDGLRNERLLKDFCECSQFLLNDPETNFFLKACDALKKADYHIGPSEDPEVVVRNTRLKLLKEIRGK